MGSFDETLGAETVAESTSSGSAYSLENGEVVGRYVVLSRLGSGGMGVVYAAYDPQLERKVALKLLHGQHEPSRAEEARKRLLREARAMAKLSHPNVITIHDVGEHGDSVFLAMEFVDGQTLRDWLTTPRTWRAILDVFVKSGLGLVAAHQRNLVHRDFKPENVMVGTDGRVRVMDFGLARSEASFRDDTGEAGAMLRAPTGPQATLVTREGTAVGTPAYMAPEQHLGVPATAASDQFSFCVSLYEALYGQRPFSGDTLAQLAVSVTEGQVREPPARTTVPGWLRRVLERGLATQADRRWPSMLELLRALSRGRRRAKTRGALFGLAGFSVVVAGVAAGYEVDRRAQIRACDDVGHDFVQDWDDATREGIRSAFVATGLSYAESSADKAIPWVDRQAEALREARTDTCLDATVRETLDQTMADRTMWCLDERRMELEALRDQLLEADARVVQKAVRSAAVLGQVAPCRDLDHLRLVSAPPPEIRDEVTAVRERLSRVSTLDRLAKYDEGLSLALETAEHAKQLGWAPLEAEAGVALGQLLKRNGQYVEAEAKELDAYFLAAGAGATEVAAAAATGLVYTVGVSLARTAEGLLWHRLAEVELDRLGEGTEIRRASLVNNLAAVQHAAGNYDEAFEAFNEALAMREEVLGSEHPDVSALLNNVAVMHWARNELDAAEEMYRRSLAIKEEVLGPGHPDMGRTFGNLGTIEYSRGNYDKALELYQRALTVTKDALGEDHPDVATAYENVANVRWERAEYDEAEKLYRRSLEIREKVWGPEHPEVAKSLSGLGTVYAVRGQLEEAAEYHRRSLAMFESTLGPDHISSVRELNNLAELHLKRGEHDEARATYEKALAGFEKALGAEHPDLIYPLLGIGEVELDRERPGRALEPLRRALELASQENAPKHMKGEISFALARALWQQSPQNGSAEALRLAQEAEGVLTDGGPGRAKELAAVRAWLAERAE